MIPDIQSEIEMGEDVESSLSSDVGPGTLPTQPPHPQPVLDTSMVDVSVSSFMDVSSFEIATTNDISAIGIITGHEIRVPSLVQTNRF